MTRTPTERTPLPVEPITHEQKFQAIEAARNAGHLVLECGPPALDGHQTMAMNLADKTDTHFWFDWREAHSIEGTDTQHRISYGHIAGFAYEGVKRRQGLLRRYARLDIIAEEISEGDRIALRIGDEVFFSERIREIVAEPAIEAAERRLQVPRLALSAE